MRYSYVFKVALSFVLALVIFTCVFHKTVDTTSLVVILATCALANLLLVRRK